MNTRTRIRISVTFAARASAHSNRGVFVELLTLTGVDSHLRDNILLRRTYQTDTWRTLIYRLLDGNRAWLA